MFTLSLANLQHSLFIAVGLCLFMLVCHILVNNQEAKEILEANAARKAQIDSLRAENNIERRTTKTASVIFSNARNDPVQCREVGGTEMKKKVVVPHHSRRKSDSELLGAGHKRSLDERLHQMRHQRRKKTTNLSQTNNHNCTELTTEGSILPGSCKDVQHGWYKQKSSTKRSMLASFGEDGAFSFL